MGQDQPRPLIGDLGAWVAVAFVGIDDDRRSRRLRWIFRKQVRQHRAPPSSPDISPGRYWEL